MERDGIFVFISVNSWFHLGMSMSRSVIVVVVLFGMLLAMPARAEEKIVAAWVNKKPITEAQVAAKMKPVLEMIHKKLGRLPDGTIRLKVREKALNSLIEREVALASKKAKSASIDPEALALRVKASSPKDGVPLDAWRKTHEEDMVIGRMKKAMAEACPPCTDAEAEALYRQKPALFKSGGRVKVSLIRLDFDEIETTHGSHRFATGLANQLFDASDEAWEDAVADYSSGSKADNGGHWDWTEFHLLPDGLGKVAEHMHVGELVKTSTDDYYYLVRLDDVEAEVKLTFTQAEEQVKKEVMRRKGDTAWQIWIKAERKNASIKIKNENLW